MPRLTLCLEFGLIRFELAFLRRQRFQFLLDERRHVGIVRVSELPNEVALLAIRFRHQASNGFEVALDRVRSAQPLQFDRDHFGPGQHGFDPVPDSLVEDVAGDRERRAPVAVLV